MSRIAELEQYICTLYDTRDQLKRHIFDRSDRAFEAGDRARDAIRNREDLQLRRMELKRAFLDAIGGLPQTDAPLNARTTKVTQRAGYRIENVIFEARPGHWVTSNVYVPDECEAPGAAVLFLSGHEYEGKHSLYYHEVCLQLVRSGLIVMATDPIGQGERLSYVRSEDESLRSVWGTREHQRFGIPCYAAGESVARYFVHDAMRAVDYLCSRGDVDSGRIGVTGNSGGGTQTAMMMVCDERIAAAAPATFIMNRRQYMHAGGVQDAEQVWPGLSALGFDHEDLLLAFAPKPLLVLAAAYDFFPIEATRRTVERCRRFWALYGQDGGLQLVEDASTHRYTEKLAAAAALFFAEQLPVRCGGGAAAAQPLQPHEADRLLCTSSGQILEDMPEALTLRDELLERCGQLQQQRAARPAESRRERGVAWLQDVVIAPRNPCALNPRRIRLDPVDGLEVEYALWWSQEGLMNSGLQFRNGGRDRGANQPFAVGLWPGGTKRLEEHWSWIRESCADGRSVLVLNVSGEGPHEPYPIHDKPIHRFFGALHKLTDDLLWLGDSLAALRIFDVLRCIEFVEQTGEWNGSAIDFYTQRYHSVYAKLAAALDDRVGAIRADGMFSTYAAWAVSSDFEEEEAMSAVLPGILTYCDLDELQLQQDQNAGRKEHHR